MRALISPRQPPGAASIASSAERAADRSPVAQRSRARQVELTATVIVAARRLVGERGDRFTIQELVKESGIALQTFYRLFASKDELLLAVLGDLISERCAQLEEAAQELPDPVQRVRFYVTSVLDVLDGAEDPTGPRFTTAQHWRLYQLFPTEMSQTTQIFADLVARQLELARLQGLLPETDPPRDAWFVTHLVLSVYHHYAFAERDRGAATSAEDLWRFCRRALGEGPSD
ncbi:MAG TPA: helix-turn-helix domain-containing protein [Acidimicrobiia bacterium]|nr:helix-turn-helix domain-containing protein [Acidimicrobiia bacterium]